ncbi:DUF1318 domain-containing protein [Sphingomonas sp.]|uniref:DUF1318 domain-containing protein n=1 Tax=Sphingomonas sp. TaxID=28214 RepID=UPI00286C05B0|nr:DUF1318 domain-containing protein [Sphingomonas sp.]
MRALILAVVALLVVPSAAQAQASASASVADARAHGLVGERFDGYLGVVAEADEALRHRVQAVNIRRRALYSDLAERRGASLEQVAMTAACQLLPTVHIGERYLASDKVWRTRVAGQELLVPDYCR